MQDLGLFYLYIFIAMNTKRDSCDVLKWHYMIKLGKKTTKNYELISSEIIHFSQLLKKFTTDHMWRLKMALHDKVFKKNCELISSEIVHFFQLLEKFTTVNSVHNLPDVDQGQFGTYKLEFSLAIPVPFTCMLPFGCQCYCFNFTMKQQTVTTTILAAAFNFLT